MNHLQPLIKKSLLFIIVLNIFVNVFGQPTWVTTPTITELTAINLTVTFELSGTSNVYIVFARLDWTGTISSTVKTRSIIPNSTGTPFNSQLINVSGPQTILIEAENPIYPLLIGNPYTLMIVGESGGILQATPFLNYPIIIPPCPSSIYIETGFNNSDRCVNDPVDNAKKLYTLNTYSGYDAGGGPIYSGVLKGASWKIEWGDLTPDYTFTSLYNNDGPGPEFVPGWERLIIPHSYTEHDSCYKTVGLYITQPGVCAPFGSKSEFQAPILAGRDIGADGNGYQLLVNNTNDSPDTIKVCPGTISNITLKDYGLWDCDENLKIYPPGEINEGDRNVQFVYGMHPVSQSAAGENTITGDVLISGTYPGTANTTAGHASGVINIPASTLNPIRNPYTISDLITIPATSQSGEKFHVYFKNWNKCNPYSVAAEWNGTAVWDSIVIYVASAPPLPTVSDDTICIGTSTAITAIRNGGTPGTLHWYDNSDLLPIHEVGTGLTYDPGPLPAGVHNYWVREISTTGLLCASPGEPVELKINPLPNKPTITITGDIEFCFDSGVSVVTLTANVTTPPAMTSFQWYKDGNPFANTASITLGTLTSDGGVYTVSALGELPTSCLSPASDPVTVLVHSLASLTNPTPVTICENGTAVFTANTSESVSYKWEYSTDGGATYSPSTGSAPHSGWMTNTLTINPVPLSYNGRIYRTELKTPAGQGGCPFKSAGALLTVLANPTANAGALLTAICQGGTSSPLGGTIGGSATGGTWSTPAGGTFTPGATTLDATWTPPAGYSGTATLTLTTSGGTCGTATNSKTQLVNPTTVGGTVNGGTPKCQGSTSGVLTLSGHTGSITKWQYSTNAGGTWTDIANTLTTYTSGALAPGTYWYRAVVQSGVCPVQYSNHTIVTVSPTTVPGSVSGGSTICQGSTSGVLTLAGHTGSITKWQYSTNAGGSWTDIANTLTTYTSGALAAGTYWYRAVVQSGVCPVLNSVYTIVTVNPTTVGGSVNGGTTVCQGSTSGLLTLSGHTGSITKWQYSTNAGVLWTDIANNLTTYTSGALAAGTYWYRAVVQSGVCPIQYSIHTAVTVSPTTVPGSVSGGSTVCQGSTSGVLTLAGHTGSITKWQYSTNAGGSWTDIANTLTTYTSGALAAGIYWYRAVVQSGVCPALNSVHTIVIVNPTTVGGSVNGGTTVCQGSTSGVLTLSGHTGSITKWQYSTNAGGTWTDIANTLTTYTSGALAAGTYWYRAVVQSGVCPEQNSNHTIVTVSPTTVPGSVSGGSTICEGSTSGVLTLAGHTGSITKWQYSTNAGVLWTDIAHTLTTYTSGALAAGTYWYRAVIQSGACLIENSVHTIVIVEPTLLAGTIGSNQSKCSPANPDLLTEVTPATGGLAPLTYQWKSSLVSGGPYNDIVGETGNTFNPPPGLLVTTYYIRQVISAGVCGSALSNELVVSVNPGAPAGVPAFVSGAISVCKDGTLNVDVTDVLSATEYIWDFSWVGGASNQITPVSQISINLAGVAAGARTVTVSASNGCGNGAYMDPVHTFTILNIPVAAAGPDQNLCGSLIATLAAVPTVGTGTWTKISGPGIVNFSNSALPTSTATVDAYGSYVLRWTEVNGGICSSFDELTVTFAEAANAGADQNLCSTLNTILAGNTPTVGTGTWSLTGVNPGVITGWNTNANDPFGTATVSAYGTYTFRWTINNTCSTTDDVVIKFARQAAAGADQNLCSTLDVVLAGNAAGAGTGTWTLTGANPGVITGWNTNANDPLGTATVSVYGTYTFRWTINNTDCSTTDDVVIKFARQAAAGIDQNLCSTLDVVLAGNAAGAGTGTWSLTGVNPGVITGWNTNANDPLGTATVSVYGTYTFRWTINNTSCSTTDDVVIKFARQAAAGADQNLCNTLNVVLAANTPGAGTGTWSLTGANPGVITGWNTNANDPLGTATVSVYGTYTFRWTIDNTDCSTTDDVVIKFARQAAAGADQNLCSTLDVVLAGNAPGAGTGTWSLTGVNPGTITGWGATTANTPAATPTVSEYGTYTFRWTINNTSCSTTDDVVIKFARQAAAGADQNLCNTLNVVLAANTPGAGTGTWSLTGVNPGVITGWNTNANDPLGTATVSVYGTYTFRWTINNTDCSTTDDVVIKFARQAAAGADQNLCSTLDVVLAGNAPGAGTGTWSLTGANPGVITGWNTNANDPLGTATVSAYGTYTFRWTINNTDCSTTDDVVIKFARQAAAGADQNLCSSLNVILSGNAPGAGTGTWSLTGANPGVITGWNTNANDPLGTATVSVYGTYTFRWTINNTDCSTTDDVVIKFARQAAAGADQNLCSVLNVVLAGNAPGAGTGTWSLTGVNPGVITGWGATTANTPAATPTVNNYGTYTFRWTIDNTDCSTTDDVVIKFAEQATAGADQNLCSTLSTLLAGNTPTVGTGTWSLTGVNPGTITGWGATTANTPAATPTVSEYGTYTFRWTINNTSCSTTDDVVIRFARQAAAGADQDLCSTLDVALTGNAPGAGTGTWSLTGANPGVISGWNTNANDPLGTATVSAYGTYNFRWTINNTACSTTDDVVIKFYEQPTSNAGSDDEINVNLTYTLAAVPYIYAVAPNVNSGNFLWSLESSSSGGVVVDWGTGSNTPTPTITVDKYGDYVFRFTETNGTCTDFDEITLRFVEGANAGPDQDLCNVLTTILSANNPSIGFGTWTQVSGPGTVTFTDGINNPVTNISVDQVGSYELNWKFNIGAGPSIEDNVIIDFHELATSNAGVNYNICYTTTMPLSGTIGGGASSGTWSISPLSAFGAGSVVNDPFIINPATAVYTFDPSDAGKTITFRLTTNDPVGACPSAWDDVNVLVNPLPNTPVITGDTLICENAISKIYQAAPNHPGSTYAWTLPPFLNQTSPPGIYFVMVDAISGIPDTANIEVVETITATGCSGAPRILTISVTPQIPVSGITGPASVCSNSTGIKYSVPDRAGSTYTWFIPPGASITTIPATLHEIDVNFISAVSGNVSVTESNGACTTTHTSLGVTVNPIPISTIFASKTFICTGETVTFTAGPLGQTNYEFFVNGISVKTGAGNTYVTDSLSNGQQVHVVVTTPSSCSGASNPVTINVFDNPTVTLNSSDGDNIICEGTFITFSAASATSVSYEFFRNGISVQNGPMPTYTLNTLLNNDEVYVTGSNFLTCKGTSDTIITVVNPLPAGVLSGNNNICPGNSTDLQVTITAGTAPYSVILTNGVGPIGGYASNDPISVSPAINTTYSILSITDVNSCTVTAPSINLTGTATVNLLQNVSITLQPTITPVCEGTPVAININSQGSGVAVNWQEDSGGGFVNLADLAGVYAGTTSNSLNLLNPGSSMNGYAYRAVVSGTCLPSVISNTVFLTVYNNPEVVNPPASLSICEGGDTILVVDEGVTTNPTFQWQTYNGAAWVAVSGGQYNGIYDDTLSITGITSSLNNKQYRAVVSGTCTPSVNSAPATLTVEENPEISLQPLNVSQCEGLISTFTIATGVTTNPSVQWQVFDGVVWANVSGAPYSGETSLTLTVNPVVSTMNGYKFRAIVSGNCMPNVTSSEASLTVNEVPEITDPVAITACEDDNVFFQITTGSTTNPAIQWEISNDGITWANVSGAMYSGINSTTLNINGITSLLNGKHYRAVVNGTCLPAATSAGVTLTVQEKPEISLQPISAPVCEDGSISYTIGTGVTTNPSITWEVFDGSIWANASGAPYSGESTNTLTVNPVVSSMNGYKYRALVQGDCAPSMYSTEAVLSVNEKPEIIDHPNDTTVCEDRNVSFTINTGATTTPSIVWQVDPGSGYVNASGAPYSGENTATLIINPTVPGMNGYKFRAILSGSCAPAIQSNEATLLINNKPEIITNPTAVIVCEDGIAVYSVDAGVTTSPTYTWEVNDGGSWYNASGIKYTGQGTNTLTVNPVTSDMSGNLYRITVGGPCTPAVTSTTALLTINEKPEILSHPESKTICEDENTSFTVDPGVTTNPSFTWEVFDGVSWSVAVGGIYTNNTTSTINLTNVPSTMNGYQYRATIHGDCAPDIISTIATLTVNQRPEVTSDPVSLIACEGDTISYNVGVSTSSPVYRWQVYNGTSWINAGGIKYSGFATDELFVNGITSAMNNYRYRAIISGICSPSDTSLEASLIVQEKPEIITQPINSVICEESPTKFFLDAGVTTSPVYLWQVDQGSGYITANIANHNGYDTDTLFIINGNSSMNGYKYRVILSGACGTSINSNEVTLTINEKPEVITSLTDKTICEGGNVTFNVNSGVTTSPNYQWKVFNGTLWSDIIEGGKYLGSTSSALNVITIDSIMNNYRYKVEISGTCNPPVESGEATLTVNTAPKIIQNPADTGVCESEPATFNVIAVGTALNYQWQVNMIDGLGFRDISDTALVYSGTITNTLSVLNPVRRFNNYQYRIVVTGTCNPPKYSAYAVLTISNPPEINTQPSDGTICEFGNAAFSVDAQGTNLTYKWQEDQGSGFTDLKDTLNYIGTGSQNMNIFNVNRIMTGYNYRVIIQGSCGSTVSSNQALLTVNTSPVVTINPRDSIICESNNATFNVTASGTGLTYQWQVSSGGAFNPVVDDTTYSGSTSNTLNINDAEININGYRYRLRVTGTCLPLVYSQSALLTVNQNPKITTNPGNAEICENGISNFFATATGPDLIYKWQVSTNGGGSWSDISDDAIYSGSGSTSLSISGATVSMNNYRFRLSASSACTAAYSTGAVLVVNANPTTSITGDAIFPIVCGGTSLHLNGNPAGGSGTYTTHSWTGDVIPLNTFNNSQPTFRTMVDGTYNLTYTVTDNKGCKASSVTTITNDRPNSQFTSDAVPSCGYLVVNFTNNSTRATSYTWDYDDAGSTDNTVNATHGFENIDPSGLVKYFNVKLIAQSVNGCRDTSNQYVTIYPKVDPTFTAAPDSGCQPVVTTFVTQPGAAGYQWDFGDGQQQNAGYVVFHEYLNTTNVIQTYTATLTTISFYGCTTNATKNITIYPIPQPNFSVTPVIQTFPDATVNITNLVTAGPWTYLYKFGDNTTSTDPNPQHTYATEGTFKIVQIVSVGMCSDSIGQTIIINPAPPVASFVVPENGCTPLEIQFVNNSTNSTNYLWDFGDGSISTKRNPSYTYFDAGSYLVTLNVSGPGGSDTYKGTLVVYPTPKLNFNNFPDSVFVNDKPIKFYNLSGFATNYSWNFGDYDEKSNDIGDNNTSNESDPVHIYHYAGWKDIILIGWNENCRDTLIVDDAVLIKPPGQLSFPTVFRPNPNGPTGGQYNQDDPASNNSVFFPGIIDQVLEYHLYIYTRWGVQVFRSDKILVGWDGYINGSLAKQGVYVWKVKGKYTNGKNFQEAGDVTLLH